MTSLNVGVIGYSAQDFNRGKAKQHLSDAFDKVQDEFSGNPTIVSGLTDLEIPALAYREATKRGWNTVGIACKKAEEFECYPVDERIIKDEWEEWGDESDAFLSRINVLIRVGGGSQTKDEIAKARNRGIQIMYEGEC
jgi:hypothetical protein